MGWPNSREAYGHGDLIVVRERESRSHGKGGQVGRLKYDEDTRKELGSKIFRDSKAERRKKKDVAAGV